MTNLKSTDDLAIPLGSLILVTGATGYIGANVIQEALDAGFRVRGTVRSEEKANYTRKAFKNHENYETTIVPDMQANDAFKEAVQGVEAIIHVASVVTLSPDPSVVIPPTIQAAVSIMNSALQEPTVKRFVYTSSSAAATFPKPDKKFHIDKSTWNDESEPFADAEPPFKPEDGFGVYSASKTMAERAVWAFAAKHKPNFVVNTVLPNTNMGRNLTSPGVTGTLVNKTYHGDIPYSMPPQYMINVVDDARIHLAAAIDKTLVNERIFAFDSPFNWGDILTILAELRPNKNFQKPKPDESKDLSTVDNELGAELLRKWWGQDGYTGLKKTVEQNIANEF